MTSNLAFCPWGSPSQRSGPRKAHRAWSGWGGAGRAPTGPTGTLHPDHPLHTPCRGVPGPASLSGLALGLSDPARWVPGIALLLPTRYSPPWYTPGTHVRLTVVPGTVWVTPGTCTYDRFWDTQGEPRGLRTQPVIRVPGWFILLRRFTRPFDWVLTEFRTSFTVSRTCFTVFRTSFTVFRTCFTEY